MTAQTNWGDVQQRAATPGSPILINWRAERQADRALTINNASNGAVMVQSSDPRVVEFFGGTPASAGVYVTPDSAQRVSAVFACVDRISGAVSTLPIKLYKGRGAGRGEVEDDIMSDLLNEQPCAAWTAASHWQRVLQFILLRGDSYALIRRTPLGLPKEIIPIPWESAVVERQSLGIDARNMYAVNDGYTVKGYDQDDVLHFPGYGFNGLRSYSVLSWGARQATGNAIAMDEYSGRFFADGAHPSIVLTAPKKMDEAQVDLLQKSFSNKYSGLGNAHKRPMVLTEGMEAREISLSAQDSQLLEARKFQVIDIARAFGVPPHMIGETSASTSWGSGIESMGRAFVSFTLQPHLVRLEQELNRKLFRRTGIFAEFDRSSLLEGDAKSQADYFRAALGGPGTGKGWMTPNEVRARKYLSPITGENELFNPTTKDGAKNEK